MDVEDSSTISGNGRTSIFINQNSYLGLRDSDVLGNGIRVAFGSVLAMKGGNTVTRTGGGTAIIVRDGAMMEVQAGAGNSITSVGGTALRVRAQSMATLDSFTIEGAVVVRRHSFLSLSKDPVGVVIGNISVEKDSAISFGLEGSGSVEVTGTITCTDTESSVDFDGQSASDIVGGEGNEMHCSGYGPGNSAP